MKEYKVRIDSPLEPEYIYTLNQVGRKYGMSFSSVTAGEDIFIDSNFLSKKFEEAYLAGDWDHRSIMEDEPAVIESGKTDHLSTCFYLISCMQEIKSDVQDHYGRFPYNASLQRRFDCVEEDLVSSHFEAFIKSIGVDSIQIPELQTSSVFLSHDIDLVNHAWKEDGKYNLKKGRVDRFIGLLFRQFAGKPDWLNVKEIVDIEKSLNARSTFFWLPKKESSGNIPNADYSIKDDRIRKAMDYVIAHDSENGLHRSPEANFDEEAEMIPGETIANRNHFLKLRLPKTFDELERSKLKFDSSLGFAEVIGFRNSFAYPYNPFNFETRTPYNFIELPLSIMDTTFKYYKNTPTDKVFEKIISFLNKHQKGNVISILWHNNYFSHYKYKGYSEIYKELLTYFKGNDWKTLVPQDVLTL